MWDYVSKDYAINTTTKDRVAGILPACAATVSVAETAFFEGRMPSIRAGGTPATQKYRSFVVVLKCQF